MQKETLNYVYSVHINIDFIVYCVIYDSCTLLYMNTGEVCQQRIFSTQFLKEGYPNLLVVPPGKFMILSKQYIFLTRLLVVFTGYY